MISATRFSALTICGPDARAGPVRHRSSSDTRAPGGTASSASSAARCPAVSAAYSVSHSRCVAASRSRATSLASRDTPGSSTSRSRSHPAASAKIAFGPSPVTHARLPANTASSLSTSAKSFSASAFWIFPACSRCVGSRTEYRFRHDGSAICSCPARKSMTSAGTPSSGSARNLPI